MQDRCCRSLFEIHSAPKATSARKPEQSQPQLAVRLFQAPRLIASRSSSPRPTAIKRSRHRSHHVTQKTFRARRESRSTSRASVHRSFADLDLQSRSEHDLQHPIAPPKMPSNRACRETTPRRAHSIKIERTRIVMSITPPERRITGPFTIR